MHGDLSKTAGISVKLSQNACHYILCDIDQLNTHTCVLTLHNMCALFRNDEQCPISEDVMPVEVGHVKHLVRDLSKTVGTSVKLWGPQ